MRFPVFRPESAWDLITLNALNFGVSVGRERSNCTLLRKSCFVFLKHACAYKSGTRFSPSTKCLKVGRMKSLTLSLPSPTTVDKQNMSEKTKESLNSVVPFLHFVADSKQFYHFYGRTIRLNKYLIRYHLTLSINTLLSHWPPPLPSI